MYFPPSVDPEPLDGFKSVNRARHQLRKQRYGFIHSGLTCFAMDWRSNRIQREELEFIQPFRLCYWDSSFVDIPLGVTQLTIEKRTFCGVELDIILGHPEHDVLFLLRRVLEAAGLKSAQNAASVNGRAYAKKNKAFKLSTLRKGIDLNTPLHKLIQEGLQNAWVVSESVVYEVLLRGHSPQTEPFRKWVTEEVLPSIRKTGSYDITKSATPEAQAFSEQNADITGLIATVKALQATVEATISAALQAAQSQTIVRHAACVGSYLLSG